MATATSKVSSKTAPVFEPPARRRYFTIADHLGSKRAIIDSDSNVQARFDYDPYGMVYADCPANASKYRYLYTGQEYEPAVGIYNYRARMYDPLTARFISTDPVRQTFSSYIYCGSNPVIFTDPTGKMKWLSNVSGKKYPKFSERVDGPKVNRLFYGVNPGNRESFDSLFEKAYYVRFHFRNNPGQWKAWRDQVFTYNSNLSKFFDPHNPYPLDQVDFPLHFGRRVDSPPAPAEMSHLARSPAAPKDCRYSPYKSSRSVAAPPRPPSPPTACIAPPPPPAACIAPPPSPPPLAVCIAPPPSPPAALIAPPSPVSPFPPVPPSPPCSDSSLWGDSDLMDFLTP